MFDVDDADEWRTNDKLVFDMQSGFRTVPFPSHYFSSTTPLCSVFTFLSDCYETSFVLFRLCPAIEHNVSMQQSYLQ